MKRIQANKSPNRYSREYIDQSENPRTREEFKNIERTQVLTLSGEGGGTDLFRCTAANGETYFICSGSYMHLDANDDEEWVEWESEPLSVFAEAIRFILNDRQILALRPTILLEEYRDQIKVRAEELFKTLTDEDRLRYGHYLPKNVDEWFSRNR